MKLKLLLALMILGITLACSDRDNEETTCTKFAEALYEENHEFIEDLVNRLAENLEPDVSGDDRTGHRANLDILIDRLNSECPSLIAEIGCYACIKTFPLQSHIKILHPSPGISSEWFIDVLTPSDESMTFSGLHN